MSINKTFYTLSEQEVEESRRKHGSNRLTQIPPVPLWKRFLNGLREPMILILLGTLLIQGVLFLFGQAEWYEAGGVFLAILLADGVAALFEHQQQGRSLALKLNAASSQRVKAYRSGILTQIPVDDIVVGDLLFLQAGDIIHADGQVSGQKLHVDQSVLNGESEEVEKSPAPPEESFVPAALEHPHQVYRGTTVMEGEAYMRVCVVGDKTVFGALALETQSETRQTPLQLKLGVLAKQITRFGYIGASAIILAIIAKAILGGTSPDSAIGWLRLVLDAFTVAVTIVVCAVPEGLPLLTSLLLSLQSLRMVKDHVLVRKLNGLETAGSLDILFCDKTGTLTCGQLSVVEMMTGTGEIVSRHADLPEGLKQAVIAGIGINNSATISGGELIGGNSTDRALLQWLKDAGIREIDRGSILEFNAFDSVRKTSQCRLQTPEGVSTFIKGAPEMILPRCATCLGPDGTRIPIKSPQAITAYIDERSQRCMRLIAVACSSPDEESLTLIAIIAIRDAVRPEVPQAISQVQKAGVQVVMVTGDRKETAIAIARETGLLNEKLPEQEVLTSADIAGKTDEELKALLSSLHVVARALPSDKRRLVRLAQECNRVVGMTGDGVNDAPALKSADVGFAMGSGTEVAREAGDITILDDNFTSIRKAILYGRTIFKTLRRFLVFQLTVNVAAVLVCFLGPLLGTERVIMSVVQLLMVNLAMDTLAAIAIGGEPALEEYMHEKPVPRDAHMVTSGMFGEILTSAACITATCLALLLFRPLTAMLASTEPVHVKSALFAVFMMGIAFNGFMVRTPHANPVRGLSRNPMFIWIMVLILAMQGTFITFAGPAFNASPLAPGEWLLCIVMALLVVPTSILRKICLASGRNAG